MDVGSSIKELRLARGLTQEELAATLYVSRQTISHWESNRTTPDAQSLVMMGRCSRCLSTPWSREAWRP